MNVIKIGGNELDHPGFLVGLAESVAAAADPVVIVHGGGQAIANMQSRLGLQTIKVDGLRVTDAESLAVAQMVLSGKANKQIVAALQAAGVDAIGLSGVDGGLLRCRKKLHPKVDLGYVGEVVQVRTDVITRLMAQGMTVVLSPISLGVDGSIYNVNADAAAGAVALALGAKVLHFISNVPGVLDGDMVIPSLTATQTEQLIAAGVITDGMIPKVRAALDAITSGVPQACIVNLAGFTSTGGTVFSA